ncbi:hypothetical protein [Brevundimonas sp.]|uniref:hypothetical protein n=1 Tax=Brevundimonas sp. TaxID=1871086 RepID=UPI003B003F17
MALLSQLVSVLAQVTGDPEPGMIVLARSLREAGYITTGGRGRSAAHMAERDAAAVLLAVAAGGDNTRAADTLRHVGDLRLLEGAAGRSHDGVHRAFSLDQCPVGAELRPGMTMLESLTLLLEQYANGECSPSPETPGAGDRRPSEISFIIRHDRLGWSGDINVHVRSGDDVYLRFTQDGQPHPPPVLETLGEVSPTGDAARAKITSIRLSAIAAHLAMNCVRGVDDPFIRRHDALVRPIEESPTMAAAPHNGG